jgi:hypothetical protein
MVMMVVVVVVLVVMEEEEKEKAEEVEEEEVEEEEEEEYVNQCDCYSNLYLCVMSIQTPCKILGFHGGDYEECRLLGCYTTLLS